MGFGAVASGAVSVTVGGGDVGLGFGAGGVVLVRAVHKLLELFHVPHAFLHQPQALARTRHLGLRSACTATIIMMTMTVEIVERGRKKRMMRRMYLIMLMMMMIMII